MSQTSIDQLLKAMRPKERVRYAMQHGLRIRHVPDGLGLKPELYKPKEQQS